jgi:hypothetical protein
VPASLPPSPDGGGFEGCGVEGEDLGVVRESGEDALVAGDERGDFVRARGLPVAGEEPPLNDRRGRGQVGEQPFASDDALGQVERFAPGDA